MQLSLDTTDPLVVAVTWALTYVMSTYFEGKLEKFRKALPIIAVLVAVFFRVVFDTASGQALDWTVVLRAIGAGGVAVLTHSQFREVVKALAGSRPETPKSD